MISIPNSTLHTIRKVAANLPEERMQILQSIAKAVQDTSGKQPIPVVFVCTHNSRRSQLAQAWFYAFTAGNFSPAVLSLSAGTEATACHPNTLTALADQGLAFTSEYPDELNPRWLLSHPTANPPLELYSKTVGAIVADHNGFIAVMVCDHADANCPFIPEAKARIALRFADPKVSDSTQLQSETYQKSSLEIAAHCYALSRLLAEGYRI